MTVMKLSMALFICDIYVLYYLKVFLKVCFSKKINVEKRKQNHGQLPSMHSRVKILIIFSDCSVASITQHMVQDYDPERVTRSFCLTLNMRHVVHSYSADISISFPNKR